MGSPVTGERRARLGPALWLVLAVGAAVTASLLAGVVTGPSVPVLFGASASRSGMDAGAVACVGLALIAVLVPLGAAHGYEATRQTAAALVRIDRALVVAAGVWLVFTLSGIVLRTADAFGRPLAQLRSDEVLQWATRLAAGRGLVLTALCASVVLGCGIVRLRDPDRVQVRLPLVVSLLGVLTPAVTGHAGSASDHQIAVITVALHVGAATLWVGGLGALLALVAPRRALLDAVLPRFSRLAGACVVAVGVTGVLNATVRVESWNALLTSGYGLLVVAKVVLLAGLGALGALTRQRLRSGRIPVLLWAGVEVALMAVTIGVAAALTQTA